VCDAGGDGGDDVSADVAVDTAEGGLQGDHVHVVVQDQDHGIGRNRQDDQTHAGASRTARVAADWTAKLDHCAAAHAHAARAVPRPLHPHLPTGTHQGPNRRVEGSFLPDEGRHYYRNMALTRGSSLCSC